MVMITHSSPPFFTSVEPRQLWSEVSKFKVWMIKSKLNPFYIRKTEPTNAHTIPIRLFKHVSFLMLIHLTWQVLRFAVDSKKKGENEALEGHCAAICLKKWFIPTSPQWNGLIPPVVQLYTNILLGLRWR